MNRLEIVQKVPESGGKTNLVKHLEGKTLSARQAVIAKCCDCMGYYVDGRLDCKMPDCSLYPFMPYRENKVKLVSSRKLSPERVQKMVEGKRRKAHV
jgi:hypothetical protein